MATPEDIQRILQWPAETRSPTEVRRLAEYRVGLHREMFALADFAERFNRALTSEERSRYDELKREFDVIGPVRVH